MTMNTGAKKDAFRSRGRQRCLGVLAERVKQRTKAVQKVKEAQFRAIIKEARDPSGKPEDYPALLQQTKLQKNHLRTLTKLLANAHVAEAFVRDDGPLSLAEALRELRQPDGPEAPASTDSAEQTESAESKQADKLRDLRPELQRVGTELLMLQGVSACFTFECGIFELVFTARPRGVGFDTPAPIYYPDPNRPKAKATSAVRLEFPPEIAECLSLAARFSGLSRSEVVAELLRRLPLDDFQKIVTATQSQP